MSERAADHYEALGLGPGATQDEIERAFRFLEGLYAEGALATYSLLEPDEASAARARVRAAYEALADPERRRAYDAGRGVPAAPREGPREAPAAAAAAEPRSEPAPGAAGRSPMSPPEWPAPASDRPPAAPSLALRAPASPPPSRARAAPVLLPEPVTGPTLRRFREERGVALAEISARTKIGVRFLEYLEADRHAQLPALVYLKAFLGEYARCLGLDVKRTVDSYVSRVRPGQ